LCTVGPLTTAAPTTTTTLTTTTISESTSHPYSADSTSPLVARSVAASGTPGIITSTSADTNEPSIGVDTGMSTSYIITVCEMSAVTYP